MATRKTVIVTEEGNKIVEAGDIITEDIESALEIEKLNVIGQHRPKDDKGQWKAGKPLRIVTNGIAKQVSRIRRDNVFGDMDCVLPGDILARRKRLVLDRMRQERSL